MVLYPMRKALTAYPIHETSSLETCNILTYELGDAVKMFVYAERYNNPDYLIEARISLSDVLAQIQLLCDRHGWQFWQLKRLGVERFVEKVERHRALNE